MGWQSNRSESSRSFFVKCIKLSVFKFMIILQHVQVNGAFLFGSVCKYCLTISHIPIILFRCVNKIVSGSPYGKYDDFRWRSGAGQP